MIGDRTELPLWARAGNVPFVLLIGLYRVTLSPFIGGQCRYEPTCSRYGLDAYRLHGPIRGTRMTIARVLRCHPFSKGGYDPVPIPQRGVGPGYDRAGTGGYAHAEDLVTGDGKERNSV